MPLPDGSIVLVSHVTEGTELELMRMDDLVEISPLFGEVLIVDDARAIARDQSPRS